MLSEYERYYGLGMDAPATVCSRNTNVTVLWFGHGCTGIVVGRGCTANRALSEHERHYALGTDALGTDALVSRMLSTTDAIMAWAWAKPDLRNRLSKKCTKMGLGYHGGGTNMNTYRATSRCSVVGFRM